MQSEAVPTAGLPNLILICPLPAIVERLGLAKPCPHSVTRDRKLYSILVGGIGILTKCSASPQVF
jgi:hypothetical protein